MAKVIDYDDSNLQRLFDALTPKQRMVAMRRAFKREANYVRKVAISNMRSRINADKDIESGIRAFVFRGNPRATGKPVLIWAEEGTDPRYTKGRISGWNWKSRKAHSTGRMRPYGFMKKTLDETRHVVTDNLHNEIINSIQKEAKKYGCS